MNRDGRHSLPLIRSVRARTSVLRNHADLRHIQAILGHTSLRTTQIYTDVSIEDLKEVVRRSHPHGRRAGVAKLLQFTPLE